MTWCDKCQQNVDAEREEPSGLLLCTQCGAVLDEANWSAEPIFTKDGVASGHFVSQAAGQHGVRLSGDRCFTGYGSTENASRKADSEIKRMVDSLRITPRTDTCSAALRVYMLAYDLNFVKGRKVRLVTAACVYLICRQKNLPFMLLDFSDLLQVNVFVLGATFLQLGKLLHLESHPILTKPVDPSLYMHRFAAQLNFGRQMHQVVSAALRLVASMKRDWLQTGRRPAGVCGAALYIAAHTQGFPLSRQDVVKVVHVGETTLAKRVDEFKHTDACQLNVEEFEEHSRVLEAEQARRAKELEAQPFGRADAGCEHIREGALALGSSGMCKECYLHFIEATGGLDQDGANPPAFIAAQIKEALALEQQNVKALPEFAGQGTAGTEQLALDFDRDLQAQSPRKTETETPNKKTRAYRKSVAKTPKTKAQALCTPAKKRTGQQGSMGLDEDDIRDKETPHKKRRAETPSQKARSALTKKLVLEPAEIRDGADKGDAWLPETHSEAEEGAAKDHTAVALASVGDARLTEGSGREAAAPSTAVIVHPMENDDSDGPHHKETLSDISDEEINNCICTPIEAKTKETLWNALNHDYISKQALKAEAKAAKEEEQQAQLLLEGPTRKKRKAGRPRGSASKPKAAEDTGPSESAVEGVKKVLEAKNLSRKINYECLENLF